MAQNRLLQLTAVLGLVLENDRPPRPKAGSIVLIRFERLQGEPDQILKIDRTAIAQGPLVVLEDGDPHLRQREQPGIVGEGAPQSLRAEPIVLGALDEIPGDQRDLSPPPGLQNLFASLPGMGGKVLLQSKVRVGAKPGMDGVGENVAGLLLIENLEFIGEADQAWPLADDVFRQPVEGPDTVEGSQTLLSQKLADLLLKLAPGGVDQRHHQNLLPPGERRLLNQPRGQQGERPGLPAPRHRRDSHPTLPVIENARLTWAWTRKRSTHPFSSSSTVKVSPPNPLVLPARSR